MTSHVFYEEDGHFKVGTVLSATDSSLQIEAPHGKRSKIKSNHVLVKFNTPHPADFLGQAQALAEDIEVPFLWECCPEGEFKFESLAQDYFGQTPSPVEAAAVALRLHAAPVYFYRKGRGIYRAAPEESLKAALASLEKKRIQAEQIAVWVKALVGGTIPDALQPQLMSLLHRPDKQSLEYKALDQASAQLGMSPVRLVQHCGGLPSIQAYFKAGFLLEHFPKGTGFPPSECAPIPDDLPLSPAKAFSIDDSATTEIDDAFSVQALANGHWLIGVHIAAPALSLLPDTPLDNCIRQRLSTVYMPGDKITMLPPEVVEVFTLAAGRVVPVVSLYVEWTPDLTIVGHHSCVERIEIVENLRHETLEPLFNEHTAGVQEGEAYPWKAELNLLWTMANHLEALRGKSDNNRPPQVDYIIQVDAEEHVRISTRLRGAPMDKLVAEWMIYANSEWGGLLSNADIPAIYRVQNGGKVKMTTAPGPHLGLGVAQYTWASSPLRRAADFFNQRQLMAFLREETVPYRHNDPVLHAAVRDFDSAYSAYNEFQDKMERYWCLRYLAQEGFKTLDTTVFKENLVRVNGMPLIIRVGGLGEWPQGTPVQLQLLAIDYLELDPECRILSTGTEDNA